MKRAERGIGARRMLLAVSVAVLPAMSLSPARAQDPLSRFLDGLFKQEQQAPRQQPAPPAQTAPYTPPAPPARGAAPQPPVSAPAVAQPPASLPPASLQQPAAQPLPAQAGLPPLPPRRPAGIGGAGVGAQAALPPAGAAPVPVQAPAQVPAQVAQAPRQQGAMPRNASEAVARVNAYLNGINTLTARFLQTGADSRQVGGTLYVQRPGRLRFAYDPPSTLEIVADGRSVAVRDSRLRTNDVYSIGQTPLKFLLRDNVDLARDVRVRDVAIDPGGLVSVDLEDSATLGGTSRVTLDFDARANVLRGWTIVDPQGYRTRVVLSGVEVAQR